MDVSILWVSLYTLKTAKEIKQHNFRLDLLLEIFKNPAK